jgi:hypothetical protein
MHSRAPTSSTTNQGELPGHPGPQAARAGSGRPNGQRRSQVRMTPLLLLLSFFSPLAGLCDGRRLACDEQLVPQRRDLDLQEQLEWRAGQLLGRGRTRVKNTRMRVVAEAVSSAPRAERHSSGRSDRWRKWVYRRTGVRCGLPRIFPKQSNSQRLLQKPAERSGGGGRHSVR